MILGRPYIPLIKGIEMKHDPNLYFKKRPDRKGRTLTAKNSSDWGFTKPHVKYKKMRDENMSKLDSDVYNALPNAPFKPLKIKDTPPTIEDFSKLSAMVTEKYGEKVRISQLNLEQNNINKIMSMNVRIPDRDENGNIRKDINNKIIMKEVLISEMMSTAEKQFQLLNVLNNTNQKLGAQSYLLIKDIFSKNFNQLSEAERIETYNKLQELSGGRELYNKDDFPLMFLGRYIDGKDFIYKSSLYLMYKSNGVYDIFINQRLNADILLYDSYDSLGDQRFLDDINQYNWAHNHNFLSEVRQIEQMKEIFNMLRVKNMNMVYMNGQKDPALAAYDPTGVITMFYKVAAGIADDYVFLLAGRANMPADEEYEMVTTAIYNILQPYVELNNFALKTLIESRR